MPLTPIVMDTMHVESGPTHPDSTTTPSSMSPNLNEVRQIREVVGSGRARPDPTERVRLSVKTHLSNLVGPCQIREKTRLGHVAGEHRVSRIWTSLARSERQVVARQSNLARSCQIRRTEVLCMSHPKERESRKWMSPARFGTDMSVDVR